MHRFLAFSLIVLAIPGAVPSGDVPWLEDVTRPPEKRPAPLRPLSPLMAHDDFAAADALARWTKRRAEIKAAWLKFLGPMPKPPKSTQFEVLRTDRLDGLTRKLIRYENEPGESIEAYLLEPTDATGERRPGLVALHATTTDTIDQIAGLAGREDQHLGLKLAQRGFVVFCPKNFLWHNVTDYKEAVARFQKQHPQTLGMHKMLYDAQRATDILAGLPNVDPRRLAALGHSLGAKETLYLVALDDRLRAGVFSEGGIAFDSTNWDAPWYLGPEIDQDDFPRNHHELLALIAPRPFLVLGGESGPGAADGERSWPYLVAAQNIYQVYGQPVRIGLLNHRQGHAVPPDVFQRLAEWLEAYTAKAN
jgi:hypothetical protein